MALEKKQKNTTLSEHRTEEPYNHSPEHTATGARHAPGGMRQHVRTEREADMPWRKRSGDKRELEAEIKNLQAHVKRLEGENRQLSGQVAVFKAARDFMGMLLSRIPACVMITDDKGRIIKASQRMQDLIGFREPELVGKHTVEISARTEELLKTQEAIFEQKAHKEDVENFESFLRHSNGTDVPISSDIAFVRDENGKAVGAVAVVYQRT